jgi:ubiquinone/menaquinone biosynthesis C-methylase UbiE
MEFRKEKKQISNFYAWVRDYWTNLTISGKGQKNGMLNFGYWPSGTDNLYDAQMNLFDLVASFLSSMPTISHGLEIGCGLGGYAVGIAKKYKYTITCLDLLDEHLEITKAYAKENDVEKHICLHAGNSMEMYSFEASTFDFAYCIESSFHYPNKQKFIDEVYKVLKPGTVFVFADITCENAERITFKAGNYFASELDLVSYFQNAGFEIEQSEKIGMKVFKPLLDYIKPSNRQKKSKIARYWELVLTNYALLADQNLMDYQLYKLRKPF